MVESATEQLDENDGTFVKWWSPEDVTAEEDRVGSGKDSETGARVLRKTSSVWIRPSVWKTLIEVDMRWFPTYVKDTLGSMTDC